MKRTPVGLISVCAVLLAAMMSPTQAWAQAYEAGPVTGGGSITGKVVFRGTAPTKKIIPTKDVDLCGGPYEEKAILTGPDQGVQNAVVYLTKIARASPGRRSRSRRSRQRQMQVAPAVQVIRPARSTSSATIRCCTTRRLLRQAHRIQPRSAESGQRIPVDLPRAGEVRIDCDA